MGDGASGWLHNSTILDYVGNLAGAGTDGTRRSGQAVGWARPLPMPRRAATATNASQPPRARPLGIGGGDGENGENGERTAKGTVECEWEDRDRTTDRHHGSVGAVCLV